MSETIFIWAQLRNGTRRTCGYIEKKNGVAVGAKVEMVDLDGEFWEIDRLSDERPASYVRSQRNRGKDFAHSLA